MASALQQMDGPIEAGTTFDLPFVAVSVIVPVAERCEDLHEIYWAHAKVLRRAERFFEFIFVLDGGFEGEAPGLESLVALGEPIRIVTLPRSFGEATALMAGFQRARGDIVLVMPSYFQVVPEGIECILNMLDDSYDLVTARRCPRSDSWINRLQTWGFHFLTGYLTGVTLQDMGCGLKGIRRRVVDELQLYGDLHRFLPILAYQKGFRVVEVDIAQHLANSKTRIYRPGVYLRRLLDILTLVFLFKFTKKPLRFFGLIGGGLLAGGLLILSLLASQRLFFGFPLADRPLVILGVLLMVLGVQTGSIGLLGELIIFTHADKIREFYVEKILE